MNTRNIAGRPVPLIGQGTWMMEHDRARSVAALRRGLDLGLTHIDTAEMYGSGRVEEIVGEAIAGRGDEVYLVSKVLPSNASATGTIAACERSLKRLGVDQLDLYLLHWPSSYPLAETVEALAELESAGKIRAFGVSNFDASDLAEAIRLAGPGRIACNQVLYHLQERAIEHAVVPACRQHGVAVVAYSPFGQGDFPEAGPGRRTLDAIAAAHGATAYQVALQFLLREDGTFVIPKTSSIEHVEDNARAAALTLTDDDITAIDAAFPRGRPRALPVL